MVGVCSISSSTGMSSSLRMVVRLDVYLYIRLKLVSYYLEEVSICED